MINADDIAQVRERAPIEQIVSAHVALKPAGVGSLKGLCPFHDERTPSFHVRPASGRWHCFGCGEGGDAIEFVMRMDGLSFVEAVEMLAERSGITLRYESGGQRSGPSSSGRKRVLEANATAARFYQEQLSSPAAQHARDFLSGRGFDKAVAEQFGLGYAPGGWSAICEELRRKGFTEDELRASGLVSEGQRGVYDRFRDRLVWPIKDVSGDVIGFGARRLAEGDDGPKYLNTPETAVYKKAHVLYGLDLAKQSIRTEREVVVVEGYTDVMACHLAGVTNAVATCGTAFGEDHVKVVRRLMGDTSTTQIKVGGKSPRVVFTFDGDEAGQNAALKSFQLDDRFLAQTYVAVQPEGLDPCDLRQRDGDEAVRALVSGGQPLFEFVIRARLASHDLDNPEGRVAALREAAPAVAGIRDTALRPEYTRLLAKWLGMDLGAVQAAVRSASSGARAQGSAQRPASRPSSADPATRAEALALGVLLQAPAEIAGLASAGEIAAQLEPESFVVPQYRAVFSLIAAAGGPAAATRDWATRIVDDAPEDLRPLVSRLAVTPLPHDKPETLPEYARSVLARVLDMSLTRQVAETRGRMQRAGEGTPEASTAFAEMIQLEGRRRALRGE